MLRNPLSKASATTDKKSTPAQPKHCATLSFSQPHCCQAAPKLSLHTSQSKSGSMVTARDDEEYPDEAEEKLVNEEYKIWKKNTPFLYGAAHW